MMSYVKHSACNGEMPRKLAGLSFFNRNTLLANMMRNREQVRYIVAPFGFGKSLLACSYANMVNNFERTFWFDAENPCFLRDLDAKSLLPDVLDSTAVGDIIVFDDVPHLGSTRRAQVWKTCSALVQAGREVVVCSTPSADPLRGHEKHCVCIEAGDLLYSEKDHNDLRSLGVAVHKDLPSLHPVSRVPSLALVAQNQFRYFLHAHIDDMDDPAQSALSFALLVLERSNYEDLELVLGKEITTKDIDPYRLRAFIQVDEYGHEFAALGFPLQEVLSAFTPHMASIAREMGADDSSEVAMQIADVLLEKGKHDRAASVLIALCDPHRRSVWLAQHQDSFLQTCALVPAEKIYGSLRSERWRSKPELYTASCLRRSLMDYSDAALENLIQLVTKVDFPLRERILAASYAYLLTQDSLQAHELETSFHVQETNLKREAASLESELRHLWTFWSKASLDTGKLDSIVPKLGAAQDGCLALACCLHKARLEGLTLGELKHAIKKTQAFFLQKDGSKYGMALVLLRRELDTIGIELDRTDPAVITAYRFCDGFEDEWEVQRTIHARTKVAQAGSVLGTMRAQQALLSSHMKLAEKQTIPTLCVNLFGGFEVRLGSTVIEQHEFKRKKVRTLLALMVLESGHDLSCDNLAERLWPDSTDLQARHNLYNCISILRKSISLADNTSPYLRRSFGVVGLDKQFVQSDVAILRDLLARLRFSDPDSNLYFQLLEQIKEVYRGDLLPAEGQELMLLAAREEWRNRVVNTLMHAARRLAGVGDSLVALQMAEQALAYNPQREDCYEQLMSLQARCGQRPAALKTWKRYRTFMVDELGLDPSWRISKLYERILNEAL